MQLISIETTNFKRLRRFKADFRQGLNVIVGDNAQGKSTLLQAIEAALYGSTVVPGKKDKIPTWGQSTWKIELTFVVEDERYRLTRSKTTAKLEQVFDAGEPQLVANGNTPVTAAVAELLDLDAKDYNLFMQSKQGETTGVLTFGAAALNRKVEEFAGISLIDRVQNLAQEEFRVAKAEADAKDVPLETLEEVEKQVEAHRLNVKELGYHVEAAVQQIENLPHPEHLKAPDADPDEMQRRLDTVTRLHSRLEKAELEVKHAEQRHQEALQRFEELDKPADADELDEQLNRITREVRSSVARVNELSRQMASREQLCEQLLAAELLMDADGDEDEIGEELSFVVEQIAGGEELSQDATRRWHEVSHRLQQIEEMREGAECPTCGTQLSEHDPARLDEEHAELVVAKGAIKAERDDLDQRYRGLDKRRRQLEKSLEDAQAHEAEVDRLRDVLLEWPTAEQLAEDHRIADEVHTGNLKEKADLEHRLGRLGDQQRVYRRAEKAVKAEYKALKQVQEELSELEARLTVAQAGGVPTEADILEARKAWSDHEALKVRQELDILEAEKAVELAKHKHAEASREHERAADMLKQLQNRKGESAQSRKTADQAGRLARFLRDRRAGYLQEVWDAVLGAASKQVAMASKGLITRVVFDDGDFLYEEDGVLAPVTSASGAQKAHIGVAIRIGLARALYGSDALLIFDEPTESMSEHHASGLSASLAGAAAQCLLITHRDQDQDLAAHVIEVAA